MADYSYYYYDANGNLVKKKKEEESPLSGWLQKGASDESVAKTILGTGTDVVGDLLAGAIGMGENIVDFGATLAGGVGKLVGADQFASNIEQFVKKDLYDANDVAKTILSGLNNAGMAGSSMVGGTYTAALKNDKLRQEALRTQKYVYGSMEQDSILAEKADSVVQSIGQMLATSGIAATTGVPWELTTAITSFGAEMDNALNSGASFGEAIGSSAISAAGEVLGEKLFSGSFLGEKGIFGNKAKDVYKTLGKSLAVNLWNTAKGYLGDMTGEAVEEVFSEIVSNLGSALYKEQNLGEILASKEALQGYLDAAVGGALMGGVSNAKKATVSAATGTDYGTGLTQNEQKVFKAEYDSRVAEAQKDGKLDKKEQQEIYNAVLEDIQKGNIDTDTIEKVLGGEAYSKYESTVKEEESLPARQKELQDTLNELRMKDMTAEETEQATAMDAELLDIEKKLAAPASKEMRKALSDNVFKMVEKDSNLRASYYERGKRSQKFEANLDQYNAKQREVVKKAVESGILNNTRKTHELVDFVAKASDRIGTSFNWMNTQKLAEAGYALEGKTVNGFVNKDGITLNIDSGKALETVVGHEITHVLEGTELYKNLSDAVIQYAKTKGDHDARLAEIKKLYEGVENANVDRELVADLVGDYLFTDTKFLGSLAQDQNLFQRLWNEVRYLYNIATAGSDEAKQLLKVKKAFEKAYQNANKNTAHMDGVKYSISEIVGDSGKNYGIGVYLDSDLLTGLTDAERKQMVKLKVVEELAGNSFVAYDNDQPVEINLAAKNDKITKNNGKKKPVLKELYNKYIGNETKQEAVVLADELIEASKYDRTEASNYSHDWLDNYGKNDWEKRTVYLQDKNNTVWEATLQIANSADGRKILYDIDPIEMAEGAIKSAPTTANNNVPQPTPGVNPQTTTNGTPSISAADTDIAPVRDLTYGKDIALEEIAPPMEDIAPVREDIAPARKDIAPVKDTNTSAETAKITRKDLHAGILDRIKAVFAKNGMDFDTVLKNAKDLSTFATVDNTPQRVMEKSLGYKEGQILSDITVNKVAQNESEGIKWLNRQIDTIKQISKQYGIKPGSKESAAAQMYAEGFYVADNNEIVSYGDAELAQDFSDPAVRQNIKLMASDPRIRQIYDQTLKAINEARTRNAYPEIPRLDNYFLHFRAMEDTFSKLGLPFNPNDIKAKDLPTDLNGVTADLKPGKPFFASEMHRKGKRTSFDMLGGLERYLNSAKNQIYHIDDIQNLRALRNYVADTYGQANGLSGLDTMSEEEAQERIKEVYGAHLSTFAKFLNEEANILAGKTSLIDRGLEGVIGRRGITFLNDVNKQVGKNMVGWNLSSSLTNFIPVAQTFAKTNKADFVKAFGQTVANKITDQKDNFAENSPVMIRRKGADAFYRTPFQKVSDAGYVLAGLVDDISTELIARTKYNELTRKGMDAQKAHYETDKWVSRLMGDRSIGQQPQLYNSKMLGLITKFQLEVRNQLDSQFYDTIQEAKVANENIEDELTRNAKTAAKVALTFTELAIVQHLFGAAFESVAGYNPAFDIIEVLMTAFGFDDEEDSEDTALDNVEQAFLELLEDLPYASTFTGGRIPIATALPVEEFITGKDEYGNEKSRIETLAEAAPYYLMPGGYGQAKKTYQGVKMFDDDLPIAGSYTKSGSLRFPVEETPLNVLQAALFGQYASANARDYFDNERSPLKEKQIEEFKEVDIPIADYWEYREGLSGLKTLNEKADYIASLDLPVAKKNILINNIADRDEPIDLTDYNLYKDFEEFDWASKNPGKYAVSKFVADDVAEYKQYISDLNDLKADKDKNGNAINGSAKKKKLAYINSLDIEYGKKLVLYKSLYPSDSTYDRQILQYLGDRDDLSVEDLLTILEELGFEFKK